MMMLHLYLQSMLRHWVSVMFYLSQRTIYGNDEDKDIQEENDESEEKENLEQSKKQKVDWD